MSNCLEQVVVERLRELAQEGRSTRYIAEQLEIDKTTAWRHARRFRIMKKGPQPRSRVLPVDQSFEPDGARRVPVGNKGLYAVVDPCDYERVISFAWSLGHRPGYTRYANSKAGVLSRFVLEYTGPHYVDHIDSDGLNNRRSNLRVATRSQNQCNRGADLGARYKGIWFETDVQRWRAKIHINGKRYNLGRFDDPIDAALAYDEAARIHHREFARLNFPNGDPRVTPHSQVASAGTEAPGARHADVIAHSGSLLAPNEKESTRRQA